MLLILFLLTVCISQKVHIVNYSGRSSGVMCNAVFWFTNFHSRNGSPIQSVNDLRNRRLSTYYVPDGQFEALSNNKLSEIFHDLNNRFPNAVNRVPNIGCRRNRDNARKTSPL
jgi:hypothetical protein